MSSSLEIQSKPVKAVGLFLKLHSEKVAKEGKRIAEALKNAGCQVFVAMADGLPQIPGAASVSADEIGSKTDCIIVLGGDGTILYAARHVATHSQTPVIGIHMGQLGFMTQLKLDQFEEGMKKLLEGRYRIKDRPLLEVKVTRKGKQIFNGLCLNELVVHRGHNIARIIDLRVMVQGILLSTIRGDGVIVATPLGSTAYSMSAGGPILHPAVQAITITSLCPHTLTNRPVVIPADSTISIEATDPEEDSTLRLTLDGQEEFALDSTDKVEIQKSKFTSKLIDLNTPGQFFQTLREKLHWGI